LGFKDTKARRGNIDGFLAPSFPLHHEQKEALASSMKVTKKNQTQLGDYSHMLG